MVQSSFNHGFSRSLVSLWVGRQWHVIIVFCLEPFIWSLNILKFYFKYPPLPYAFWLFSGGIFHCPGRCTDLSVLHMAHNRGGPLEKWMKLHLAEEHSRRESTVITPPLHLIPPLVASTLTTTAYFQWFNLWTGDTQQLSLCGAGWNGNENSCKIFRQALQDKLATNNHYLCGFHFSLPKGERTFVGFSMVSSGLSPRKTLTDEKGELRWQRVGDQSHLLVLEAIRSRISQSNWVPGLVRAPVLCGLGLAQTKAFGPNNEWCPFRQSRPVCASSEGCVCLCVSVCQLAARWS